MSDIINADDYSWWKVLLKHWKKKLLTFFAGFIKNSKRISWSKKKQLTFEFACVLIIVIFLAVFFYLIFWIIKLIQQ